MSEIAILGAGFSGICMAVKLLEAGHSNFVIYEKAASLGGTWRDNTYPGCACDVPSQLYSYSFAQQSTWSRTYATQPEILAYIKRVAEQFGVERKIVFETTMTSLLWDESQREWRLLSADGREFKARTVVSGVGGLHLPKLPEIAGLESFAGPAFHTARWRHDVILAGKNVAVIGTGASAVQIIPEIAATVGQLHVFQRTHSAAEHLSRSQREHDDQSHQRSAAINHLRHWQPLAVPKSHRRKPRKLQA